MNNVAKLLAQLGASAELTQSFDAKEQGQIKALMAELKISDQQQQAILQGDVSALNCLLDICPDIVCRIDEPDEDDDDEKKNIKCG